MSECSARNKFREVFKLVYLKRERYRTNSRSLRESVRLAWLAAELSQTYLRVIVWREWKRRLEVS
ncbi:MAG: hypothetical protein N3E36_00675 [Sulfolobales archaeon]|nr:hypothetical protein [Sulfolobales archaeon]MCX8198537.1 hypothetical protein [Sulfolobales archaeon]MDW8169610.1 hypothetical protein [Desulfurococcaceae archaeon]